MEETTNSFKIHARIAGRNNTGVARIILKRFHSNIVCEYVDYIQQVDYGVKCWNFTNTITYFLWLKVSTFFTSRLNITYYILCSGHARNWGKKKVQVTAATDRDTVSRNGMTVRVGVYVPLRLSGNNLWFTYSNTMQYFSNISTMLNAKNKIVLADADFSTIGLNK